MTPVELRALLAKATSGVWGGLPWRARNCDKYNHADAQERMACFKIRDAQGLPVVDGNTDLIVTAVNALPALLDVFDAAEQYRQAVAHRRYLQQQGVATSGDEYIEASEAKRNAGESLFALLAKLGSK